MNILIVSHYYAAHGGGIEAVIRQLVRTLGEVAPKYRFTWVASDCDAAPSGSNLAALPMGCSNIVERRCGIPQPLWSPAAFWQLARAVARHDLIWLHDTLYLGNIAAWLLAKGLGKPIVITQHIGMIPYRNPVLRLLLRGANRLIAVPMLKWADQSIFIAAQVRGYFAARIRRWRRQPRLILNGVQTTIFKPVTDARRVVLRQKFGLGEEPTLLFVGRFVSRKGLPILHRLAQYLPHCSWIFAGHGPCDPGDWRLPHTMVLRDRSGAGIAELMQAADLLLLPSIGEGLPLVMQEAAACGLPILCGTETAAADPHLAPLLYTAAVIAKDPTGTAYNWAEQLKTILADREERAARSMALVDHAATHWSWTKAAQHYATLFTKLTTRPNTAP